MKRIANFLSLCTAVFFLTACGETNESSSNAGEITSKHAESVSETEEKTKNVTKTDEPEKSEEGKNILVAYFSATGITKKIAEAIADETGADIYAITPAQPYSDDDLNYNDDDCRANREQNDKSFRTEISGTVDNFDDYETVFIGYPIWWGEEPRIIDTFMETYDFSGKTAIPFCTSGGSGISTSENNLNNMCPDANWLDGKRFSDSDEVSDWIKELGVK